MKKIRFLVTFSFFTLLFIITFNPVKAKALTLENGKPILLKSCANNKYVTAESGGNGALVANRDKVSYAADSWEQFDVVNLGNSQIALKSHANGKYVCADNTGANPLIANRDGISNSSNSWEVFDVVNLGDEKIALRSHANGKYVCADNSGSNPLIANRDSIGSGSNSWEVFKVEYTNFIATFYTDFGNTANGTSLSGKDITNCKYIAVDPTEIPINSQVYVDFGINRYQTYHGQAIDLNGWYTAVDTGSLITDNRIDVYIGQDSEAESLSNNIGRVPVVVMK